MLMNNKKKTKKTNEPKKLLAEESFRTSESSEPGSKIDIILILD